MKHAIILILAVSSLHSCAIIKKQKNKLKENVATHVAVKNDSSSIKTADSSSTAKTTATHHSKETSLLDTNFTIPGSSLDAVTDIPDTGETYTFETGEGSIAVGLDSSGKLQVKAKTKPKVIPLKINHTKEVFDTHASDVKTNLAKTEAARVSSSLQVDSTRHTNSVLIDKKVNRIGAWWMWALLILAVICYAGFKVYTKGINPLRWFK